MLAPAAAKSLRGGATGTYTSSGALLTAARAALCERGAFVEHHVLCPVPSLIRHACVLSHACFLMHFLLRV